METKSSECLSERCQNVGGYSQAFEQPQNQQSNQNSSCSKCLKQFLNHEELETHNKTTSEHQNLESSQCDENSKIVQGAELQDVYLHCENSESSKSKSQVVIEQATVSIQALDNLIEERKGDYSLSDSQLDDSEDEELSFNLSFPIKPDKKIMPSHEINNSFDSGCLEDDSSSSIGIHQEENIHINSSIVRPRLNCNVCDSLLSKQDISDHQDKKCKECFVKTKAEQKLQKLKSKFENKLKQLKSQNFMQKCQIDNQKKLIQAQKGTIIRLDKQLILSKRQGDENSTEQVKAPESSVIGDDLTSTYALVHLKIDHLKSMIQSKNNVSDGHQMMISQYLDLMNQQLKSTTLILKQSVPEYSTIDQQIQLKTESLEKELKRQ